MAKNKLTDTDPQKCGLVLLDEIDGYRIYEDPVTTEIVERQWQEYYEDEE